MTFVLSPTYIGRPSLSRETISPLISDVLVSFFCLTLWFSVFSFIFAICSGVVPQHPPTIFIYSFSKKLFTFSANVSGVSLYTPSSLGNPALGYAEINVSVATSLNLAKKFSINSGPVAQFNPIDKGFICLVA